MLSHLSIQNYALIRHLEIDFKDGLTVITGETGAGKSILLGALNLILGNRADTQVLFDKSRKCIVEGVFHIGNYNLQTFFGENDLDYEDHSTIRREIGINGKSRAFINDTPVTITVLKELGEKLIDIHSQNNTVTLSDTSFQIAVVDSYSGISEIVKDYKIRFLLYYHLKNELDQLIEAEIKSKSEQDYFQFLVNELEASNLKPSEQPELEQERDILNHAEDIKSALYSAIEILNGSDSNVLDRISAVRNSLNQISKYREDIKTIGDRIDSSYIELNDIVNEIRKVESVINYDPDRIRLINERLDLIYQLQNKHRVQTVEDLLNIKSEFSKKLSDIASLQHQIEAVQKEVHSMELEITEKANAISEKRQGVFQPINSEIESSLVHLGMPYARFQILHKLMDNPGKDGIDTIKFLFNANRGGDLQEIAKVASGGEFSRLMLAIKSLISQRNLLPTVIFDEIDMGVSGAVADMVGNILVKLSSSMQVLAITHLPQIAGKGDSHYFVYKVVEDESTKTEIQLLQNDERVLEIAKMLSGQEITPSSVESAKHLLK